MAPRAVRGLPPEPTRVPGLCWLGADRSLGEQADDDRRGVHDMPPGGVQCEPMTAHAAGVLCFRGRTRIAPGRTPAYTGPK